MRRGAVATISSGGAVGQAEAVAPSSILAHETRQGETKQDGTVRGQRNLTLSLADFCTCWAHEFDS